MDDNMNQTEQDETETSASYNSFIEGLADCMAERFGVDIEKVNAVADAMGATLPEIAAMLQQSPDLMRKLGGTPTDGSFRETWEAQPAIREQYYTTGKFGTLESRIRIKSANDALPWIQEVRNTLDSERCEYTSTIRWSGPGGCQIDPDTLKIIIDDLLFVYDIACGVQSEYNARLFADE